ncbi:Crp/Fnr family transcriptional regulator [Portibacter lacus]|uniref:cAMP-binding protein n=1 Tax=Portibacter lacus TaxID=1099794 RepID=A0AA37SVU3_9BACT|nr:Crp/Fnr family transcriptional regulator [Portibacter lacus]GLR19746.1 cAMP-binding protein [Portibacter lacus]
MQHNNMIETLREFPILSECSDKELEWLSGKITEKSFFKGETIYREGEDGSHVYFVTDGSAKLGITSSCGKILIKDIVHASDVFGENIFTSVNTRKEFAEVMKGTISLLMIRKDDFQKLLLHNQRFANSVINLVVTRLNALEKRMENFIFKKAKARIVDFIVNTGKNRGIKIGLDELLINHGMSHKEIAFLTDTSRQTVARVLGELKKDSLIHFSSRKPSKILIRDFASLNAF